MPSITIGMPVYNDKKFLSKALKSLLNQTFTDFEIIISDDGSSDGSAEICKKFSEIDKRIKYIRQKENLGISKNMKYLLDQASGDYFMWAANDDLWHPQFIEKAVACLEANDNAIVAFGKYIFIDEEDQAIQKYKPRSVDYSSRIPLIRLLKLIWYFDDGFGYGLFKRKSIQNVSFPVWWGVNKKTAYDNIYPSLFYYLSRGNFAFIEHDEPLWLNRLKSIQNINHTVAKNNSLVYKTLAFALRKINLLLVSSKAMYKDIFSILCIIIVDFFFIVRIFFEVMKEFLVNSKHFLQGKMKLFTL